MIMNLENSIDI